MDTLIADLRFAIRALNHRRTFTLIAILTIALGIGPTTTMYTVMSGVLLNPLGYQDPGRLVVITGHFGAGGDAPLSMPEFHDLQRDATPGVFAALASTYPVEGNLTGPDRPDRVGSSGATGGFFNVLGVKPLLGRTWNPSEEVPGFTEVTVISYHLWQNRFGGKSDVLGKQIRIDDDNYTIIASLPAGVVSRKSRRSGYTADISLCAAIACVHRKRLRI